MAMARKKPRLATVPEVRYSVGEDAVDFMQISQEPADTPEMAARRHGCIFFQTILALPLTLYILGQKATQFQTCLIYRCPILYISSHKAFIFLLLPIPKSLPDP